MSFKRVVIEDWGPEDRSRFGARGPLSVRKVWQYCFPVSDGSGREYCLDYDDKKGQLALRLCTKSIEHREEGDVPVVLVHATFYILSEEDIDNFISALEELKRFRRAKA